MQAEQFMAWARTRGYQGVNGVNHVAFGVHKDYPVCITAQVLKSGEVAGLNAGFRLEGKITGKFLKVLRKTLPKGCGVLNPGGNKLNFQYPCRKDDGALNTFEGILDAAAAAFREEGLTAPRTCAICKQGGCDGLAQVDGYVAVHQSCVKAQAEATMEKVEHNEASGNYITGFLGALLGAVVGTLPTIVALLLVERIYAILYALIPLAAYQGYKICKGKMNKGAFACSLIASLFGLFALEYIYVYIIAVQYLEMMVSPALIWQLLMAMIESGDMTRDLVMSVVFLALGLWISWGRISHTNRDEANSAAAVLATLQPYQPGGAPAESAAAEVGSAESRE